MTIDEKELQKNNEYQQCQRDILDLQKGIKKTGEVWNKYLSKLRELIKTNKIKSSEAKAIQLRIELLNNHWETFKKAWEVDQQLGLDRLMPRSPCKEELDCFAEKLTELHDLVQKYAYPGCLDKCYQFIKTCLLKLYNSLIAGPGNLSGENVYIAAAFSGQTVIMPTYRPNKYNHSIFYKMLNHNTALLKEDFNKLEKRLKYNEIFQKATSIDIHSPKR